MNNYLKQEIKKGDTLLRFIVWGVEVIVVRETRPVLFKPVPTTDNNSIDLRHSRVLGIRIYSWAPQTYNVATGIWESQPRRIETKKCSATNLNQFLRLDNAAELNRYGFNPDLITKTYEVINDVMNGIYDKKSKK